MQTHSNGELGFAHAMFGNVDLGDRRRNDRLVKVVEQIRKHPGGTLPDKFKSPDELKAMYRLCDCQDVTHDVIISAARTKTLEIIAERSNPVLILHDSTELDYTSLDSLSNSLGQIGKGKGRGYICHNSLAVNPAGREVFGLTGQILHCRAEVPKNETMSDKRQRDSRESLLWLRGTKGLPADWRLVDVCDQGADTFEFIEHAFKSGRRFAIRSKRQRAVYLGHEPVGKRLPLQDHLSSLPLLGTRTLKVQSQKGKRRRSSREAVLHICAGAILVPGPHARHGCYDGLPLPMWVVYTFEPNPPKGEKPLLWAILTNEPVRTLDDATRVLQWYETRWIVEELHKAMKTGCSIETLQFTATDRLEPMIALLSIVAATLLNLRTASRREDAKTRPATEVVSIDYIRVLSGWRYGRVRNDLTVHEFFYALARLGGHQNRKHDKPPGWLILWRGWTTLQAMSEGVDAIRRKKCG